MVQSSGWLIILLLYGGKLLGRKYIGSVRWWAKDSLDFLDKIIFDKGMCIFLCLLHSS